MTGAAHPGAAGTAAGASCHLDGVRRGAGPDGFCDTCGHAASPPPVVSRTAPALPLPRAAPEATGRHAAPTAAAGANNGTPTAPPTARPTASPTAPPTAPRHGDPTVMPTGSQHGVPTGAPSGPSSTTAGGRWSGPLSTGPTGSSRLRRAGATDDIPPVPRVNPSSALLRDPQVPERDRFCRNGGKPHAVGRSRDGRPGLVRGYCPQDGTPFSFAPPLPQGDLVAGQYEVRGALAHGGLGWIYLAVDRNVDDRWVVLKGLLDAERPGRAGRRARRAAVPRPAQPPEHRRDPQLRPARRPTEGRRLHRHGVRRRLDARSGCATPGPATPAAAGRPGPRLRAGGAARARLPARRAACLLRLQAGQRHPVRAASSR